MNNTVNLRKVLLVLTLFSSIFGILFLKWSINNSLIIVFLPLCVVFNYIFVKEPQKVDFKVQLLLIFLSVILAGNFLIPSSRDYFFDAVIKGTIMPVFVGLYFMQLKRSNCLKNDKILKIAFYILNIFAIFNFFIMLKQISSPGFMVHNRTANTFYIDMITGLVGENGTHKLSFLYIGTLYLNIYFFESKNKFTRAMAKMFFVYVLLSSLYISAFNDNRTYYFILIFAFIPYILKKVQELKLQKNQIMRLIFIPPIIIASIIITYKCNTTIREFVDKNIVEQYVMKTINRFNASTSNTGGKGEERIELLKYSVSHTNLLYGKGIGSIHMTSEQTLPKHFGLNDVIVRIYTGGIPFAIVIILLYTEFTYYLFPKKNIINWGFCLLYCSIAAFYTQAYAQIDKTFLICFSVFMITLAIDNKKSERNLNNE